MTRRTSRPSTIVFLLLAAGASLPGLAQVLPPTFPGAQWEQKTPAELGMNAAKLEEAKAYALTRNGAGLITRNGYQVASWGKSTDRYPLFSVTKAVGALLLGNVGKVHADITLDAKAQALYADFAATPVDNDTVRFRGDVTIEQLATHSAGFEKVAGAPRIKFQPGTQWVYSDGGANWLADILTFKAQEDLRAVLQREFLTPLAISLRIPGVAPAGMLEWRDVAASNPRGTTIGAIPRREFNAGISASVDAMARLGLLVERKGTWNAVEIVPAAFIERMVAPAASIAGLPITDTGGAPDPHYPNATAHHGLLWWNNADGAMPNVPTDAHWAWGLGDHLIVVIPSLGIVVARTSGQATEGDLRLQPNPWKNTDPNCVSSMCAHYDALDPFLTPIVQSVENALPGNGRPVVNAGEDATISLPTLQVTLTGTATDDGQPAGSTLATQWSVVSGDGVTIATPTALTTIVTFTGAGTYTLRLSATDSNLSANDDVVVTVAGNAPPAAPVVTLTSNPTTVTTGGTATLNWSASNADACTASNGWSGTKATSGTETVTVAQTTTYTLACTGAGGTTQASVDVTATAPTPPPAPAPAPPPEDSGGGGGMVQWWMLLALAVLGGLRRAFVPGRRRGPIPV